MSRKRVTMVVKLIARNLFSLEGYISVFKKPLRTASRKRAGTGNPADEHRPVSRISLITC
jgi:hypothetical protein